MVAAGAKPCTVEPLSIGLPFASCPGWETIKAAAVLLAAMVAAEYKTNHHFVRRGSSPEVKMSESKVQPQMVNEKYNYFRIHALLTPGFRLLVQNPAILWKSGSSS